MPVKRTIVLIALVIALSGCASLAVRPCDSVGTRDSKYAARFFLGIITLGISESGIQREQAIEAREGWRFCPPPMPVAWQGPPPAIGPAPVPGMPRTPGMFVNATRWTLNVYLDGNAAIVGVPPTFTLRPGESRQVAMMPGPHRILAQPAAGTLDAAVSAQYQRQIQIDPRDRHFRLQITEADFR
jgi:hypothetical protein